MHDELVTNQQTTNSQRALVSRFEVHQARPNASHPVPLVSYLILLPTLTRCQRHLVDAACRQFVRTSLRYFFLMRKRFYSHADRHSEGSSVQFVEGEHSGSYPTNSVPACAYARVKGYQSWLVTFFGCVFVTCAAIDFGVLRKYAGDFGLSVRWDGTRRSAAFRTKCASPA